MEPEFDVVIVGAGMVGASLAHALDNSGYRVAVIEAVSRTSGQQPSYDDRHLALSLSSQRILGRLGLWSALSGSATAIKRIHVSDQHRPGMVRMSAGELGVGALGFVVVARDLGHSLLQTLEQKVQAFYCPARVTAIDQGKDQVTVSLDQDNTGREITGRLLVLADGSRSRTRSLCGFRIDHRDYGQTAIVCNIRTELPHRFTAYERFTPHGPFALLPSGPDRMAMVYTVQREEADRALAFSDDAFIQVCQQQFGRRLGRLSCPGRRASYEISLQHVVRQYRKRTLLLGNSAHTLHPNAAQGFNLALRDVAGLSAVLEQAARAGEDPGCNTVLERYQALRTPDQSRVLKFTDTLARLFYTDNSCLAASRNLGLMAMELLPGVKQRLLHLGTGLDAPDPVLA